MAAPSRLTIYRNNDEPKKHKRGNVRSCNHHSCSRTTSRQTISSMGLAIVKEAKYPPNATDHCCEVSIFSSLTALTSSLTPHFVFLVIFVYSRIYYRGRSIIHASRKP